VNEECIAVSMAKRKNRSMMLSEIERVRGEQLRVTPEAQRFAESGVQCLGHRIKLFLGESTHLAPLGQVLLQQTVDVLVGAALPGTVRICELDRHSDGFHQP